MTQPLEIDGSRGEGGGQVLRSSLALSLVTGTPFTLRKVRAGRRKPGLMRQHLTCVLAAAEIGGAKTAGAELGSTELRFAPGQVKPGEYRFAVGTAGSATLVLQTILPPLLLADGPSLLTLEGGTHNPMAPPFDFLERAFLPQIERQGPKVSIELERHGFYPAGGGRFHVEIEPVRKLRPFELLERGKLSVKRAKAIVTEALPANIGERELELVRRRLELKRRGLELAVVPSAGPGNALLIELSDGGATEVVSAIGERGVSAEQVAKNAVREARRYVADGAPVGEHLADQLLLPLALAGSGSFRTARPSRHTTTNIEIIERFLPLRFELEDEEDHRVRITVRER